VVLSKRENESARLREAETAPEGGGGKTLNTASVHEEQPRAGAADYDCSKYALRNLTRTLVLGMLQTGMTVTNVGPGMVLTPFNQKAIDLPASGEEQV
jgi:glucose 1-dehydrogenase